MLSGGYQSWSPALVAEIGALGADAEDAFENAGQDDDLLSLDARSSWWYSALPAPGATLVSGALTASIWKTKVLTYRTDLGLVWKVVTGRTGGGADAKVVETGGSARSERVLIGIHGDARRGLEEYARSVAALGPAPVAPFVPVGWNSWNTFFADIDEATILGAAQALRERFPAHGFSNVQIDGGWSRYVGDWAPDAARFPSGMDGMAGLLADLGFVPGIWMAPFLVDPNAPVFGDHPEWLLRDDEGMLLTTGLDATYFILDPTHPQARDWMVERVEDLLDWGYRYLKLDCLYAGAFEGAHYRGGATSLEGYREVMRAILDRAASRGAYVLACGAPILPTAGLAHGNRIGGDIALAAVPYSWMFIKNEARNTALRYMLDELYAADPDTALLRDVPIDEARVNLTAALLAGRIFALGDDLTSLPPEKIDLVDRIAAFPAFLRPWDPAAGSMARPRPRPRPLALETLFASPAAPPRSVVELVAVPSSYDVPEAWALVASDAEAAVGLFNWSDEPRRPGFSPGDLGLEGGSFRAAELWTGDDLGRVSDRLELDLPAHGVALVWIGGAR